MSDLKWIKKKLSEHLDSKEELREALEVLANIEENIEMLEFQNERLTKGKLISSKFIHKTVLDLEQANLDLSHSNQQLNRYVHIAAHDLKTPLRTIGSFTGLLTRTLGDNVTETQHEYVQFIIDACKMMSDLLSDILTYSSVANGKLNMQKTDMTVLVSQCVNLLQHDIQETQTTIHNSVDDLILECDPSKIKQVFLNLLANAIKFSAQVRRPVICIKAVKIDQYFQFSVKDNGIGIKSEYKDQIFEQFKRLNGKKYEGTGMGLSICKTTIEQHGGKIWIESELDQGTSFHFTLKG